MVSSSCPETKLLIVPAKDSDELDIMEDEVDDMQCEMISNVSSRCLYHRIARKLSNESRRTLAPRAMSVRANKRRRGGPAGRRVNYRESVWGKNVSMVGFGSVSAVGPPGGGPTSASEKEISNKFYKPSSEIPEKLEPTRPSGTRDERSLLHTPRLSPVASVQQTENSEVELFTTMLSKRRNSNPRAKK